MSEWTRHDGVEAPPLVDGMEVWIRGVAGMKTHVIMAYDTLKYQWTWAGKESISDVIAYRVRGR